ncbi:MAG: FAD-dependent oxidoreductase, partial [Mesorhizobium sp.]
MVGGAQTHRLANGGLIDRSTPLSFRFDGKTLLGFQGDTLASALVANGVKLVGRSFKYHRPRGILTAGSEEPNALVELRSGARREPNTKATTAVLYDGLEAASQNRWPSLRHDFLSVNQLFAPIFVAGFYYKTFMWPAKFWEAVYEPAIRRAAGLGRTAGIADPDHYDKAWAHCDVLIAGSGPAGLAAALAAGRCGARVILCEEDFALGGRLLADGGTIDGLPAAEWIARTLDELGSMPDVRIMTRTTLFGVYDGGTYGAIERVNDHRSVPPEHQVRQRLWRIVAKRSIVAAGAIERPIVFAGNDTPGVMMAAAMRSYVGRYAATPAKRVALFTNNEDGWRTVETALRTGLQVAAVIDARPDVSPAHRALASKNGFAVLNGSVTGVDGGKDGVRKISVSLTGGARAEVEADGLAVSGGWNPSVGLTSYHRGRPKWRDDIAAFVPDGAPPGMVAVGAANGAFGLSACLREGFEVAGKGKAFVDQQHDVTASDVELAQREGFESVEHLKRYTTLGMATDQGKTSNIAGLAIMAAVSGKSIPETGTTIYRPPYVPVAIGAFAGHHRDENFHATRLTPSHHWAAEQGAVFVDTGLWKRAQWYPRAGEKDWLESVTREVKTVRGGVGFCDVSTLGKIDVHGPDAGAFLDRVYIN